MKGHAAIGARLRAAREAHGMTLRTLADSMGVTSSLLSQIETDKVLPSLNTLYQLATRLDLSVDELLGIGARNAPQDEPAVVVQRQADNPSIVMAGGVRWERLARRPDLGLEPLRITYGPGTASSLDRALVAAPGLEFGIILSGTLTLRIGFESHVLETGDSVFFDRSRPHVYVNDSDQDADGIWLVLHAAANSPTPTVNSTQIGSLADVLRVLDSHEDW